MNSNIPIEIEIKNELNMNKNTSSNSNIRKLQQQQQPQKINAGSCYVNDLINDRTVNATASHHYYPEQNQIKFNINNNNNNLQNLSPIKPSFVKLL
jgi:hypothetical protein